jgi:uncharacterized membrane protein YbhN (UPF0104 family)
MTSSRDESPVDGATEEKPAAETRATRRANARATTNRVRSIVAQVIWLVCVVAALILAIGALCIALEANPHNSLVTWFVTTADKLDLGVFSRHSGVFHWRGHSHAAQTKNALVNWGIAAVVWLVVGRILERIIRPSTPVTSRR